MATEFIDVAAITQIRKCVYIMYTFKRERSLNFEIRLLLSLSLGTVQYIQEFSREIHFRKQNKQKKTNICDDKKLMPDFTTPVNGTMVSLFYEGFISTKLRLCEVLRK